MTCYACNNPATTSEHVPPKCLFPEQKDLPEGVDLRRNLITIPSCDDHNLQKSGNDEYLMYVLAMNLPANVTAECHFTTKISRAIERRPSLINSILQERQPVLVVDDRTREAYETDQLELDGVRFEQTLNLIALGIYYHHYGMRWDGNIRVHPDFIAYPYEANVSEVNEAVVTLAVCAEKLFAGAKKYGENPEVFSYQLLEPDCNYRCLLRFNFYGGCKATAFFTLDNTRV